MSGANRHDFLVPPHAPDEIGRPGGYRVLQVLGSGGKGVVFLAEDVQLRRRVALKTMRAEVAANATARQRFLREARAMAAVKCDHIATIYQVGEERRRPAR
jgi:serine/threonine protein kinase